MFKFLEKTTTSVRKAFEPTITVKDVHAAFDQASDHTLELANQILAKEVSDEFAEYQELGKLGFTGMPAVKEVIDIGNNIKRTKAQIQSIQEMAKFYPNHKFILKEDLTVLLKKFQLLLGNPKDYIGGIPSQNRKEVLAFVPNTFVVEERRGYSDDWYERSSLNKDSFREGAWDYMLTGGVSYKDNGNGKEGAFRIKKEFKIVAPANMFNLEKKMVVDGKIVDIPKPIVRDPVVLFAVPNGYIIVSKWGLEADIEEFKKGSV